MLLEYYIYLIKIAHNRYILDGIYFNMLDNDDITITESIIICQHLNIKKEYLIFSDYIKTL